MPKVLTFPSQNGEESETFLGRSDPRLYEPREIAGAIRELTVDSDAKGALHILLTVAAINLPILGTVQLIKGGSSDCDIAVALQVSYKRNLK